MHNLSNRVYINYHKPIWGGLISLAVLLLIIFFDKKSFFDKPTASGCQLDEDVN